MGSYVPNTLEERQEMLKEIGYSSIEDLFAHIPDEVKIKGGRYSGGKSSWKFAERWKILRQRIRYSRPFSEVQEHTDILFHP